MGTRTSATGARSRPVRGQPLEDRQREGGGLAGAGGGLAEQVAALDQRRDRLLLDRRGLLVAERGQRLQQLRPQAEVVEGGALLALVSRSSSIGVHRSLGRRYRAQAGS